MCSSKIGQGFKIMNVISFAKNDLCLQWDAMNLPKDVISLARDDISLSTRDVLNLRDVISQVEDTVGLELASAHYEHVISQAIRMS